MGGITTAQNDAPSRALEAHRTAHLGAVVVHVAIADGADWRTVDLPGGITTALCHDIRSYYEEAALDLVTGALLGPHALVDWFVERTLTGHGFDAPHAGGDSGFADDLEKSDVTGSFDVSTAA